MGWTLSWTDVALIAPELAAAPSGLQALIVAWVQQEFGGSSWTDAKAKRAATYLAAHLATVTISTLGGLPNLQSVSVGPISQTFAGSVAQDASSLLRTGYGAEYVRLRKLNGSRMAVL